MGCGWLESFETKYWIHGTLGCVDIGMCYHCDRVSGHNQLGCLALMLADSQSLIASGHFSTMLRCVRTLFWYSLRLWTLLHCSLLCCKSGVPSFLMSICWCPVAQPRCWCSRKLCVFCLLLLMCVLWLLGELYWHIIIHDCNKDILARHWWESLISFIS